MKTIGVRLLSLMFLVSALCVLSAPAQQKVAFIAPEKNSTSEAVAENLETHFVGSFKILDSALAQSVFRSQNYETPFNLTLEQARNFGKAVGCDFYIFVKAETLARTSLDKGTYQESYAAVFAVGSRTGKLIFWNLVKTEEATANDARKKLLSTLDSSAKEFVTKIQFALGKEVSEANAPKIAEPPDENSFEAKSFRPPLPFRRVKPEYTLLANLYSVAATIDVSVDVDADGKILRTEIMRWAGFGLDESVAEAVRKMNWRPAEREGKTLPIRVLLRYNFRKIESVD